MRLTRDVYLVGGGPFSGFGLTPTGDSHVYLIDGGEEMALIDCGLGTPESFARIMANIEAEGLDPARIKTLFLTHYHADHAGGAATYRKQLGASVAVAREAGPAIESADEDATGLAAARTAGIYPQDYRLQPCRVDEPLDDGATRSVGKLKLTFVATPGHSLAHGSFLVQGNDRTSLFAGDAVFWTGQILLQAVPDCDLQQSIASVLKLERLQFDAFLPGHGAITVEGGRIHVDMAAQAIRRLGIPRNLV